jgi:hypothetical protein
MEEALQDITDFINKKTSRMTSGTVHALLNELIPALEEERGRLEPRDEYPDDDEY